MELTLWKVLTGVADADSLFHSRKQTHPDFVDTAEPDWILAAKLAPDVENRQALPSFVPQPHKLSSAAHALRRGPRTGLLSENETWVIIAGARRFSTSTPKGTDEAVSVCVPASSSFFHGTPGRRRSRRKSGSFSSENLSDKGIFFA